MRINRIYRAIQGEGSCAGIPVTLIRFQGCNRNCWFCDTPEAISRASHRGEILTIEQILFRVDQMHPLGQAFLLTGGEPFLQADLGKLINSLVLRGPVHIETNASLPLTFSTEGVFITASPKAGDQSSTLAAADEIKWLVGCERDLELLEEFRTRHSEILEGKPILLQPLWVEARDERVEAMELCYVTCLEKGYRLSLQMHKFLNKE